MSITGTGKVGIGTATPQGILEVDENGLQPADGFALIVKTNNQQPFLAGFFNKTFSPTTPVLSYYGLNDGSFRMGTNSNTPMHFYTSSYSSIRMSIAGTGNVGIGTVTPTERLDVTGNIKVSGAIMPNNLPGTSGQVLTSAGPGLAPTWTTLSSLNGKSVLNGTSNPVAETGVDGDFYINTASNTLFGPKASGAWAAGVSLVGPIGLTGATGATGPAGANGSDATVTGTAPINVASGVVSLNDAGVTSVKIADNAVTSAKIVDATIVAADLATDAVTTAKILDGTISTADVANNAITIAKLPVGATATTFLRGDGTWGNESRDIVSTEVMLPTKINGAQLYAIKGDFTASGSSALVSVPVPSGMTGYYSFVVNKDGMTFRNSIVSFNTATSTNNVTTGFGMFTEAYPAGNYSYVLEYFK
jgi:hypothetical protein